MVALAPARPNPSLHDEIIAPPEGLVRHHTTVGLMSEVALPVSRDLERLFDGNVEMVFGFLVARCGDRAVAEDLTGETFLAASRQFESGLGSQVNRSWLLTVARRRLIDHWRRSGTNAAGWSSSGTPPRPERCPTRTPMVTSNSPSTRFRPASGPR